VDEIAADTSVVIETKRRVNGWPQPPQWRRSGIGAAFGAWYVEETAPTSPRRASPDDGDQAGPVDEQHRHEVRAGAEDECPLLDLGNAGAGFRGVFPGGHRHAAGLADGRERQPARS